MNDNPITALSDALGAAIYRDLPDIEYENRDWIVYKESNGMIDKRIKSKARPTVYSVETIQFLQTWGSTALGYGGIGGATMTPAYTTLVIMDNMHCCVYFGTGGRLAYKIPIHELDSVGFAQFNNCVQHRNMPSVGKAGTLFTRKAKDETSNI